jgi:hypothetical protein
MQELYCSRQELSGDTHDALVQPEKVVRAPARYKTPSQPWTMATNSGNSHLTPHTRHCALYWRVRLMGNDPLSNQIQFWGCWGGVWPSMRSFVPAMMHHRNIGVCWGPYTPSTPYKRNTYPLARGVVTHLSKMTAPGARLYVRHTRGRFLPASAVVGHCCDGRCWPVMSDYFNSYTALIHSWQLTTRN